MVVETLRAAVRELVHRDITWAQPTIPLEWEERYGRRCKAERLSDDERDALAVQAGDDGQWLLERLEQQDAEHLRELRSVSTLRQVWAIQYARADDGHMRWVEHPASGGTKIVETPYDPDAHWATKRGQDWVGYKLQVTETDDAGYPHLITDIAVVEAAAADNTAIPDIRTRQQANDNLPGQRFADCAYISGELIKDGKPLGEDLIGPIRDTVTPQSKIEGGFTHEQFQVNFVAGHATCPGGYQQPLEKAGQGWMQAAFPRAVCEACDLRARCCTGKKNGRVLRFGPHYHETQAARKRQKTEEFKQQYGQHRGGIEGCLSALVRSQGCRTTRYDGQEKNHLHALLVGAAVNLARSSRWRVGYRPKKYPPTLGLAGGGGKRGAAGANGTPMAA